MGLRIVIGGGIARNPIASGGNAWAFLQYILGFRRLGHDVLYVEEITSKDCVDDAWRPVAFEQSANAQLFAGLVDRHGLAGHAALLLEDGREHLGLSLAQVHAWGDGADLLVNLSGRLHMEPVRRAVRRRVYVDLDPGFTQIW